jgi:hypothetical protein
MRTVFDYLFYCFYCLTSERKFDRAGAGRSLLSLFSVFALLDGYTLLSSLANSEFHFFAAAIVSTILTQALLSHTYFHQQAYTPLIIRYAQGEPERLRFALTGCAALLGVLFLPFLFIKIRHL